MALWTPATYTATSKIWLVSDNASNTLVSTDLSVLADKGGGGFDYTAGNSGAYGGRGNTLNSRVVLNGDATTKRLGLKSAGATAFAQNQPGMTIFVVNRANAPTSVSDNPIVHFSKNGASNTRLTLSRATNAAGDVTLGVRRLDADGFTSIQTGTNHGSGWLIIAAQVDFVAGTGLIRVNGAATTSGALGTSGGNSSNTASLIAGIGEYDDIAQGAWLHDEAEIVIVQGALSVANMQLFEGYLAGPTIWNLQAQLDAAHPYKSSAPTAVNIVSADGTLLGDNAFLFTASKILAGVYVDAPDAANAYLAGKILAGNYVDTPTDLDLYLASAITAGASAILGDNAELFVGGATAGAVWDGSSSDVSDWQSNAIASGQGDMTIGADGVTLWIGGGIGGAIGDIQGAELGAYVRGAIIAADFAVDGVETDMPVSGFILSAMGTLIADCLIEWSTSSNPGDQGSHGPAGTIRRMQRTPTSRVMVRLGPPRKMTR